MQKAPGLALATLGRTIYDTGKERGTRPQKDQPMLCYAIGDIHGHLHGLERALALIEADGGAGAPVVFVGDYTDRGPDSAGVLDLLIEARATTPNWIMLKGNHDRMFRRFLADATVHDDRILSGKTWLNPSLGGTTTLAAYLDLPGFLSSTGAGRDTLAAYGIDHRHEMDLATLHGLAHAAVPQAHLDFIDSLPLTHEIGELLFVHAGLRPGVALDQQAEDDLIWIRDPWLTDTRDHGALVVHGHTALDHPQHHGNRVNIDGGAGYGRPLVPVVFEGRACWTLTDAGRVPLTPK